MAIETPEQSASIVHANLVAMGSSGLRFRRHCCATWSDQYHAEVCENYGGR
jgi:hypothetical protein